MEKKKSAVLTVHDRLMYIVCLDVLSTVCETSYGIVINVTWNAYWAAEESLHQVKQRAMEKLNSSAVSGSGIAANISSSGGGGGGGGGGHSNSSGSGRSSCNSSSGTDSHNTRRHCARAKWHDYLQSGLFKKM